jgi:hypothetical protein
MPHIMHHGRTSAFHHGQNFKTKQQKGRVLLLTYHFGIYDKKMKEKV